MKFSNGTNTIYPSSFYVKMSEKEFNKSEESNSLLWEIKKTNIDYDKNQKSPVHLYMVPARAIKSGGDIYNSEGKWIGYRVE